MRSFALGLPSRRLRRAALCLAIAGGFLNGASRGADGNEWPREIETAKGLVVVYQPQVDRLEEARLYSRAAVSVTLTGQEPVLGAVWMEATLETDTDRRMVKLVEIDVPQIRFPESTPAREKLLSDLLVEEVPTWNLALSQDRLLAMLDLAEKQEVASQGFSEESPTILFVEDPAILVTYDGPPEPRKVKDSHLQIVINTPFYVLADSKLDAFFLYAGNRLWYQAGDPLGPWAVADAVPSYIQAVTPADETVTIEQTGSESSAPPAIVAVTQPTELVVTDGPPQYTPIAEGQLLYVSNSESDILKEVATQQFFVLLAGRWYASPSLDGPWELVHAEALPASFLQIPEDSERGHLLTWVPGTELAQEAVLDASIPQTAVIRRDATIEVTYDGEPQFEPIEGTGLKYAVNSQFAVIQADAAYYCAHEAVWYVAERAHGPWRVADEIPEEILAIPPDCPLYHCKFLQVYDSTAEVVHVGYYPGYVHSYVYHGCLVYGTGWYYRPWRGRFWYYPRPRTWGIHARWNPWHGWGFGFSYSTGRFSFALGTGSTYRRSWWGSTGYRGYRSGHYRGWNQGYNQGRRDGYRTASRDSTRNLYQHRANAGKVVAAGAGAAALASTRISGSSSSLSNNIFADRNGNVYRRQSDGSWQSRRNGQWVNSQLGAVSSATRPATASAATRQPATVPSTARTQPGATISVRQPTPRPVASGSSLSRDYQARQRGTQRSNLSSGRTSSPTRSRPSGGGARRGGGRGR